MESEISGGNGHKNGRGRKQHVSFREMAHRTTCVSGVRKTTLGDYLLGLFLFLNCVVLKAGVLAKKWSWPLLGARKLLIQRGDQVIS